MKWPNKVYPTILQAFSSMKSPIQNLPPEASLYPTPAPETRKYYGSFKYQALKALLVGWGEDNFGVRAEIDLLGQLLERVYGYEVEKWHIPSRDPFKALDRQVRASAEAIWEHPASLFILYYAGHARPSRGLGSFPRWSSKRFEAKEVDPRSAQLYLENAECDVLFLHDCCHSIHAGGGGATAGVKEALAAGGLETITAEVGEHSFTHLMINELARAAEQGHAVSVSNFTTACSWRSETIHHGSSKTIGASLSLAATID
ncbi:hypothetical protein B0T14DRAFT_567479 [Immersiella caudata]|uniref:Uncharacterized protein n=1 Tax=Immersiella caudata TaxID=314043 RepID=A0AA39WSG3_9PEZI|nr:hypothetical protein B0T14DRAFT_567479 [Immersiella caudata]